MDRFQGELKPRTPTSMRELTPLLASPKCSPCYGGVQEEFIKKMRYAGGIEKRAQPVVKDEQLLSEINQLDCLSNISAYAIDSQNM